MDKILPRSGSFVTGHESVFAFGNVKTTLHDLQIFLVTVIVYPIVTAALVMNDNSKNRRAQGTTSFLKSSW